MNITAFKNALRAALREAGTDLDIWCNAEFGMGCWVRVRRDYDSPPDQDICPCVDFKFDGLLSGQDVSEAQYAFSAVLTIFKEGTVDHDDEQSIEPEGVDLIAEFTALVRDVFINALSGVSSNASLSEFSAIDPELLAYPYFQADLGFYVNEPIPIGQSPF